MSGWRHFGIGIENDTEAIAKLLLGEYGDYDEKKVEDGFLCLCMYGYGEPIENPDPRLVRELQNSRKRGYYVVMNDTTDTAEGLIRFRRKGLLVDITSLVDKEINQEAGDDYEKEQELTVFDGKNSRLPEFQMGAPCWDVVYALLDAEGFPVAGRYS